MTPLLSIIRMLDVYLPKDLINIINEYVENNKYDNVISQLEYINYFVISEWGVMRIRVSCHEHYYSDVNVVHNYKYLFHDRKCDECLRKYFCWLNYKFLSSNHEYKDYISNVFLCCRPSL